MSTPWEEMTQQEKVQHVAEVYDIDVNEDDQNRLITLASAPDKEALEAFVATLPQEYLVYENLGPDENKAVILREELA